MFAAAFSPDGRTILTGCMDNYSRLWNVATGQLIGQPLLHQGGVMAVAFSPDGKTLLTGSLEGRASSGTLLRACPVDDPCCTKERSTPSPSARMDFLRSPPAMMAPCALWDPAVGGPIGPPLTHPRNAGGNRLQVHETAFSPDGTTVLTNCEDHTARVWNIARFTQKVDPTSTQLESQTGLSLNEAGMIQVLGTTEWNSHRLRSTIHEQ